MKIKYLELKNLLNLKPRSLEKRFSDYYNQEKDSAYIIQAAVVVMVRNFFSIADFSFLARDLIRDLFLDHASELVSVRHLCIYFREYFSDKEWDTVLSSLYASNEEYLQVTEFARLHTDHIQPMLHTGSCDVQQPKNLSLTFFDELGKKHRCTIKDVHRSYSTQENCDALSILGTLTIFQKDGVRRFTQLAKSRFVTPEDDYDHASKEELPELWVTNDLFQQEKAPKNSPEMKTDTRSSLKQFSAHVNLKGKTKEELTDFLFEGIAINDLPDQEKFSRTATAMLEGIPVKEAPARFSPDENPEEILNQLLADWQLNLMTKETTLKDDPEAKARQEEILQQRQLKREQQKLNKVLRKSGKGKKGKRVKKKRK
ncbi:hypothetical protein [Enterococcus sp. AZ109]|uniref:hypothetical protein n=1 Tax=Enterococcus sp. AZ109 TaxID=2774634 RepID=UPI003F234A66